MAIASLKPTTINKSTNNAPKVEPEQYKGIVTDTKYVPLQSLLVFVEGSIWTCDYYSQVTNRDSDLRVEDSGQSPIYQQYNRIVGLELKVDSPLSANQSDDTKYMTVAGSAFVNPFFVPEAGDMFIADTGNGNDALFVVNNSERKSYLKDSVFLIEYTLLEYVKDSVERVTDLKNKTVNTTYFRKDYALKGQDPFLTTSDNANVNKLAQIRYQLLNYFFDNYYNSELSTLILPGQTCYIYDHYLTSFVFSLVDSFENNNIRKIRRLNLDGNDLIKKPTLLTAFIKWDANILKVAKRYMGFTYSRSFGTDPTLEGVAFSGVNLVVYPLAEVVDDAIQNPTGSYISEINNPRFNDMFGLMYPTNTDIGLPISEYKLINGKGTYGSIEVAGQTTMLVKPVFGDTSYILSDSFYDNKSDMSIIEALLNQYLNNETILKDNLIAVCEDYYNWTDLDRFYYTPILILLIKYAGMR